MWVEGLKRTAKLYIFSCDNSNMSEREKSFEVLKTLRQQAAFVESLQQRKGDSKGESKTNEMERMLSNSIKKAKEKLTTVDVTLQHKTEQLLNDKLKQSENINTSNVEHNRTKSIQSNINSSAVASALKCLQAKISTLELQLSEGKAMVAKMAEENQEGREREALLKSSKEDLEKEVKQLREMMRRQEEEDKREDKESLLKAQTSAAKNNDLIKREMARKEAELQQKYSKIQKELTSKENELKKRVEEVSVLQKDLRRRESTVETKGRGEVEELYRMNQKYKEISEENRVLVKELEMSKADYFKLETEMELLKQREEPQQEMEVAYVETIERLEEELRRTKNKTKFEDKIEALKAENEKIREQYNNMYTRYTRLEQRFKDEEKETKLYRNKYWETKELLSELSEKVQRLPSGVSSQLKYLTVKVNKLERESGRTSRSFSKTSNTGSKTDRLRSDSKSIRSGKKKTLKVQDLNNSRASSKSISMTRSRVMNEYLDKRDKSVSKRDRSVERSSAEKSLSKRKKIFSTKKSSEGMLDITDKELRLSTDINELQKLILGIKKEYKALAARLNDGLEEDPEGLRSRLNDLTETLQLKTEQMADLRIKIKNI